MHAGKSLVFPPAGAGGMAPGEACPPARCLQALLAKADILISSNFQGKGERSFDGEATGYKDPSRETSRLGREKVVGSEGCLCSILYNSGPEASPKMLVCSYGDSPGRTGGKIILLLNSAALSRQEPSSVHGEEMSGMAPRSTMRGQHPCKVDPAKPLDLK